MTQPAPPGYTPGRYDRFFTDDERRFLSRMSWNDLSPEIDLLRFCIERFTGSLSGRPVTVANLRLVSNSIEILGKLISTQNEVHSPIDEFNAAVDEALRLARIQLGLLPPDPIPEPLPPLKRESRVPSPNVPMPNARVSSPQMPAPSVAAPAAHQRKPSIRPP